MCFVKRGCFADAVLREHEESNKGNAAKDVIDGAALNDGDEEESDQGDEHEDEQEDEQEDEIFDEVQEEVAEGALVSPAKRSCGRTPRRSGIEFLQVTDG